MTSQVAPGREQETGLRILPGRKLRRKPSMAPWMIMALLAVVAFLGLGLARTSLDKTAFELADLNKQMDQQVALNQQLRLEAARLGNPARIAPLAEDLGMILPDETTELLVDLESDSPVLAQADDEGSKQ